MNAIAKTPSIIIEDRTLFFTEVEGTWYIAVKPICEALGLDWTRYFKNLKADPILGRLLADLPMVAGDGRSRKMTCLPERYIYGWIFQLPSTKPGIIAFKTRCYDALYDHFHGTVTARRNALVERAKAIAEQRRLRKELENNPTYKRLMELEGVVLSRSKLLKEQDRVVEYEQLQLFGSGEN